MTALERSIALKGGWTDFYHTNHFQSKDWVNNPDLSLRPIEQSAQAVPTQATNKIPERARRDHEKFPKHVPSSKQRVDMAKVDNARIATRGELVHAVHPAAWTAMEKANSKLWAERGTWNLSPSETLKQNS